MNIELQVGKRYETRGGEWIAGITGRDEAAAGTDMEFVGYVEFSPGHRSYGRGWCANGRFIGYAESVGDLIRELPDASSTPEPEPAAQAVAEMEFETGPGTATDGPATEKVVVHWDREGVTGYTSVGQQPRSDSDATAAWFRTNIADTRAGIARKYAQAAMFVMLGIAAIIFAIGTSVQA